MGRGLAIWGILLAAVLVPLALAANSPLLAWRAPIYSASGFAGILAMGLLLVQPLLALGVLPGLSAFASRRVHRLIGVLLALAVIGHVIGLWITSPPDVIDALLLRSPTSFSIWGVLAMWAVFATAVLGLMRRRLRPWLWRLVHCALACVIVFGTVIHAVQIEGTMNGPSKAVLAVLVLAAMVWFLLIKRVWMFPVRKG